LLALDADEAGAAATLRGLMVARDALDREAEVSFDWRGLIRTEGRLGADIRVMTLPLGLDPDDVIRRDPAEWQRLSETAEPVVEYVIRVLTTGRDLHDPKVKTEIAEAVLPLIDDVPQAIERDTYRQKLARVLRVDERSLSLRPKKAPRPARSAASPTLAPPAESEPVSTLEVFCLGMLVQAPDLMYKIDRELQALSLPKLSDADFISTEHQVIWRVLHEALEQMDIDHTEYLRDHLDPLVRARLDALAQRAPAVEVVESKNLEALITGVLRLRRRTVRNWLTELRFFAEDAREQGDARAEAYEQEISQQARALAQVDRALASKSKRGAPPGAPPNPPRARIG